MMFTKYDKGNFNIFWAVHVILKSAYSNLMCLQVLLEGHKQYDVIYKAICT